MKIIFYISTLIFMIFSVSGCQKALPEPELLDPIYKDLVETAKKMRTDLEAEEKNLATLKKQLDKADARSVEKKILSKDYSLSSQTIHDLKESLAYYEIRMERRKFVDRMTYKIAFEAGQKWPDPKEYSDYLVNKRLKAAPRQWSERVPKLNDRIPSSKGTEAKEKASSETEAPAEH